jgi:hypothetical protein
MKTTSLFLCLILSFSSACTTIYQAQRPISPNVEKAGDIQIDLDSSNQGGVFYALTDTLSIGGTGRFLDITGSSQASISDNPQSFIRGGSLNLGYHRRLKNHPHLKYGFLGGCGIESWSGQDVREVYDMENDVSTFDIQPFEMMLAIPQAQFLLSYGGRYTFFQINGRISYLQPFSRQLGTGLVFDESVILEASALGQVSLYDQLSMFFQVSLHGETISKENRSYAVMPMMLYVGLSYSFGSDGSLNQFSSSAPKEEKE